MYIQQTFQQIIQICRIVYSQCHTVCVCVCVSVCLCVCVFVCVCSVWAFICTMVCLCVSFCFVTRLCMCAVQSHCEIVISMCVYVFVCLCVSAMHGLHCEICKWWQMWPRKRCSDTVDPIWCSFQRHMLTTYPGTHKHCFGILWTQWDPGKAVAITFHCVCFACMAK